MVARLACVAALVAAFLVSAPERSGADTRSPQISAESAVLIDRSDGTVLWEKEAEIPRAIASTTKIVTALVVIEMGRLDETVIASANAEAIGTGDPLVTELELLAGERISVRYLLHALLMVSANDAAIALAEHFSGSVPLFVERMNEFAARNGAKATHFVNPHGFDESTHVSTALDLAILAREGLKNPTFSRIVSTRRFEISRERGGVTYLENRNQLLGTLAGADGVKTGQTKAAGKALVASATRGEERRIAVVLGATDSFADVTAVIEYGFSAFRRIEVAREGKPWGYLTYGDGTSHVLVPRSSFSVLLEESESDPLVEYRRGAIFVTRSSGAVAKVGVETRCISICDRHSRRGWVMSVWEFLAPVARLISSLFSL